MLYALNLYSDTHHHFSIKLGKKEEQNKFSNHKLIQSIVSLLSEMIILTKK